MAGLTAGRRLGRLTVTLTGGLGGAVAFRAAGEEAWRSGGPTGSVIDGLDPGTYEVRATPTLTGYAPATGTAVVTDGDLTTVALTADPALGEVGGLLGTTDNSGALISWALRGPTPRSGAVTSGGSFNATSLTPGSYALDLSATGYVPQTVSPLTVTAGQVTTTGAQLAPRLQAASTYEVVVTARAAIYGNGFAPVMTAPPGQEFLLTRLEVLMLSVVYPDGGSTPVWRWSIILLPTPSAPSLNYGVLPDGVLRVTTSTRESYPIETALNSGTRSSSNPFYVVPPGGALWVYPDTYGLDYTARVRVTGHLRTL